MVDRRRYDRQGIGIQLEVARLFSARPGRMPSDINVNDKAVIALKPVTARVRHHAVKYRIQATKGGIAGAKTGTIVTNRRYSYQQFVEDAA